MGVLEQQTATAGKNPDAYPAAIKDDRKNKPASSAMPMRAERP